MIQEGKQILRVNLNGIPYFLRQQPYWANWKVEYLEGKGRKVPTYGNVKLRGQYWETKGKPFMEAVKSMPADGGLGLLLTLRNNLCCIDIDNCTKDDPRLAKILTLAPGAWCEYSPSGNGIHIWGILPNKQAYLLPERKTIGRNGKEYEWFATGRSITVTGHHICGHCFPDLTKAVQYCESLHPKIEEVKRDIVPITIPVANILKKAFAKDNYLSLMYHKGHTKQDKSAEDFLFCRKLWFWLGGHGAEVIETIFRNSAMYRKSKGAHYPSLTVRNAEKRWDGEYYGKKYNN